MPAAGGAPSAAAAPRDPQAQIWYCKIGGQIIGPVKVHDIRDAFTKGQIDSAASVGIKGHRDWFPIKTLPEFRDLITGVGAPPTSRSPAPPPAAQVPQPGPPAQPWRQASSGPGLPGPSGAGLPGPSGAGMALPGPSRPRNTADRYAKLPGPGRAAPPASRPGPPSPRAQGGYGAPGQPPHPAAAAVAPVPTLPGGAAPRQAQPSPHTPPMPTTTAPAPAVTAAPASAEAYRAHPPAITPTPSPVRSRADQFGVPESTLVVSQPARAEEPRGPSWTEVEAWKNENVRLRRLVLIFGLMAGGFFLLAVALLGLLLAG